MKIRNCLIVLMIPLLFSCASNKSLLKQRDIPATLYGKIYDGNNQPCASVRVTLTDENDKSRTITSDVMGSFYFPEMEYADYTIALIKERHKTIEMPLEVSIPNQTVYLKMYSIDQLADLAEEALSEGYYDRANAYIDDMLTIDSESAVGHYLNAVKYWKTEDYEAALQSLDRIDDVRDEEEKAVGGLREIILGALNSEDEKN